MSLFRREFLKLGAAGALIAAGVSAPGAKAQAVRPAPNAGPEAIFDVRRFGAVGDGAAIDTPAVNRAIDAASAAGGGVVLFPAGTYACYTIRLKSRVVLHLGPGATILAAPTPLEGTTTGGYDAAESNAPWEAFQDYGHNHWRNSLIWGEGLHDVGITGPGRIWGKGLSRGHEEDTDLPRSSAPGVGNKAIALKNCRDVILRDVSILQGGWFAILATGVDNLTIDNLKIDTNRDGMDIDCCRNVRVSNCSVNSPWDDGICPKSSFALGYARPTENVTISNCYVTGAYQLGTLLDGTFKPHPPGFGGARFSPTGRIKCGTESNGGFKNITISNCVFDGCRGFALETVDGAVLEDITFTGVAMRGIVNAPFFFRLGARMRGPAGAPVGSFKRVIVSDVTCVSTRADMPSLLAGIPDHPIEDIKIADVYLSQPGGGTAAMISARPEEHAQDYPEPTRFGPLPASAFYVRHARNLELSNVEVALRTPDPRPLVWLEEVDGFDAFRLKTPRGRKGPAFRLEAVRDFRVFGSPDLPDARLGAASGRVL